MLKMLNLSLDKKRKLIIKSDEERLVYGEVYVPYHVDTDGATMTASEIKKMAHNFLKSGNVNKIDVSHDYHESGCVVVESMIIRGDNDPDGFVKDSWVIGANIIPDNLWKGVQKGDFNGFSFGGMAFSETTKAMVKVVKKAFGETEDSLNSDFVPIHSHKVDLVLDTDGRVLNGIVHVSLGHTHDVKKTSSTEIFLEHNHRLVLVYE